MVSVFKVLSASGKATLDEENLTKMFANYLTLGDKSPASGNRYYVRLTGDVAKVDWQEGDRIMAELSILAYNHHNQWHSCHHTDSIELIEIGNSNVNFKVF